MSNYETVKASCLCGQATTDIPFEKASPVLFCSCGSCRRCLGAPFLTGVGAASSYSPSRELLDKLIPYNFSDRLTQYHCRTCGTIMFTCVSWSVMDPNKSLHWDIMSGTLERYDGVVEVACHEFIADTLDGGFADFLTSTNEKRIERWSHRPWKSEQLPVFWRSPDRPVVQPGPSDKLHVHCKCGGVEFWISRPSEQSKHAIEGSQRGTWWLLDGGKKFLGMLCVCNSCRLDTGAEFQAWVIVPTVNISLDVEGKAPLSGFNIGTLKEYRSSDKARRYHCGTCGASVLYASDEESGLVNVAAGVLDASEGARAESWVEYWTARLSSRGDAVLRAESLAVGMENGLRDFAEKYGLVHKRPAES